MTDGETSEEGVDSANLHTAPATVVSERRRLHVVFNLGHDDRKKREIAQDPRSLSGSFKPLKELLDYEAGRDNQIFSLQASGEEQRLGSRRGGRPAKRKRPNARIDEDIHARERSAL